MHVPSTILFCVHLRTELTFFYVPYLCLHAVFLSNYYTYTTPMNKTVESGEGTNIEHWRHSFSSFPPLNSIRSKAKKISCSKLGAHVIYGLFYYCTVYFVQVCGHIVSELYSTARMPVALPRPAVQGIQPGGQGGGPTQGRVRGGCPSPAFDARSLRSGWRFNTVLVFRIFKLSGLYSYSHLKEFKIY